MRKRITPIGCAIAAFACLVVAGLLLSFMPQMRRSAYRRSCLSNLRIFGNAFCLYDIYEGAMPPCDANLFAYLDRDMTSLTWRRDERGQLTGDLAYLRCPSGPHGEMVQASVSYGFNFVGLGDPTGSESDAILRAHPMNGLYSPFSTSPQKDPNGAVLAGLARHAADVAPDTFVMIEYWGKARAGWNYALPALDSPAKLCKHALRLIESGDGNPYTNDSQVWREDAEGNAAIGRSAQEWPGYWSATGDVPFRYIHHRGRSNFLFADGHAESLLVKETAGRRIADGRGHVEFAQWTALGD